MKCSKEYLSNKGNLKYCSRDCYDEIHNLKKKICPVCKMDFNPINKNQIHCNKICYSKSNKLKNLSKDSYLIKSNKDKKWHLGHLKDNVGYSALHDWVKYYKEKSEKCEICQLRKNGHKDYIDLANISGEYKRDINDFAWLCRKCHRNFDIIKRIVGYDVMFVECKSAKYMSQEEKKKARWLVQNLGYLFYVAYHGKNRGEIIYEQFTI